MHVLRVSACSTPRKSAGFTLVETVIAAAICLGVVLGVVGAFALTLRSVAGNTLRVQAAYLQEEGLEVVRMLRDDGWAANIAPQPVGTPVYLVFDGTTWKATTTKEYIDGLLERSVIFENVYRNSSQDIVMSGGSLDSNTKKVTVSVSWKVGNSTTTRALSTYFTNVFNN